MKDDIRVYILDSFAVLAYLQKEAGADEVKAILRQSLSESCQVYLPVINLGEVIYITEREQSLQKAQEALAALEQLPIKVLPVSRGTVLEAAHIKAQYPVAYADAFTIAAAQSMGGIILTGDPEFKSVEHLVGVRWLGEKL